VGQLREERHLVEIVLGLAGDLDISVPLDLRHLWAILVMVAVASAALWANVFHFRNRIMEVRNGNVFGTWIEP
jgi:hypothetical protein